MATTLPEQLQAGCYWRFDWFRGADNPAITLQRVRCPLELTSKTKCVRADDTKYPVYEVPGSVPAASPVPAPSPGVRCL